MLTGVNIDVVLPKTLLESLINENESKFDKITWITDSIVSFRV